MSEVRADINGELVSSAIVFKRLFRSSNTETSARDRDSGKCKTKYKTTIASNQIFHQEK